MRGRCGRFEEMNHGVAEGTEKQRKTQNGTAEDAEKVEKIEESKNNGLKFLI
jgi:hypothetical protein